MLTRIFCAVVAFTLLTCPATEVYAKKKKKQERPDLEAVFSESTTEFLLAQLKKDKDREAVEAAWSALLREHSQLAQRYNSGSLYENPNLQAFVNNLGQSLIPEEADEESLITFKIVNDPVPEVYALATGTVFVTTGLISLVENESQLAFILAHEAGHVLANHHLAEIVDDTVRQRKAKNTGMFLGALGAAAGAVAGSNSSDYGGMESAVMGAAMLGGGGQTVASFALGRGRVKYHREIEVDADRIGMEIAFRQSYDIRDAEALIVEMSRISRHSSPEVGLSFAADTKMLDARLESIGAHLAGDFEEAIDNRLAGEGFRLASPRFNQLMSELKRDNGLMALQSDLFAIAKANLESAEEIRTDDPLTMYGLGLLYRAIGRTQEDRYKAVNYFKRAIQFDHGRSRFPRAHLEYAVELINMEDPSVNREIQHHLKTYVSLYQRKSRGALPPEMTFVYDYLDLAGDREWIALPVLNVNSNFPYVYTGDERLDEMRSTSLVK